MTLVVHLSSAFEHGGSLRLQISRCIAICLLNYCYWGGVRRRRTKTSDSGWRPRMRSSLLPGGSIVRILFSYMPQRHLTGTFYNIILRYLTQNGTSASSTCAGHRVYALMMVSGSISTIASATARRPSPAARRRACLCGLDTCRCQVRRLRNHNRFLHSDEGRHERHGPSNVLLDSLALDPLPGLGH